MAVKSDVKVAQTVREIEQAMLGPNKPGSQHEVDDEMLVPAERRPIGKFGVILLTCLAWLTVLFGLVLFVMFDPTEDKKIQEFAARLNPENEPFEMLYADDIKELQDERRDFEDEKLAWLEDKAEEEEQLAEMLEQISEAWEEVDEAWEAWFNRGEGETTKDIRHLAKSMELMDAAAAARLLAEMDYEDAAKICLLMKKKKLAPILAAMEMDAALKISETMMDEDDWDF